MQHASSSRTIPFLIPSKLPSLSPTSAPQTDADKDGTITLQEFLAYTAKNEKFDENDEWKPVVDDPSQVGGGQPQPGATLFSPGD